MMKNRIKAPVLAVAAMVALSGCDILDVLDPNALIEESVQQEAASNGVANGSLQLFSRAISDVWEGPAVVADELYWIGSRDAWGALDNGAIGDNANEFTDAAFPSLGRSTWMAQTAVSIIAEHVANNPGVASFELDFARAQLFKGMILAVTAEQYSDMTFSDKQEDGAPVSQGGATIGPDAVASMDAVMGVAIASLSDAISRFNSLGEGELVTKATAVRARAYMSRVIMANRSGTMGALAFPLAVADANSVLSDVGGDWQFAIRYSSTSDDCDMCGNVNQRKENQFDLSLVNVDANKDIISINMMDPVSGNPSLALIGRLDQWKGGSFLDSGDEFNDLVFTSARLMHLIIAEDAMAGGNMTEFEDALNEIRDLDGEDNLDIASLPAGFSNLQMLQHDRRMNVLMMGLRLQDMYRWQLSPDPATAAASALWQAGSTAVQNRGEMLPIAIIEVRANCHLNGQTCAGG